MISIKTQSSVFVCMEIQAKMKIPIVKLITSNLGAFVTARPLSLCALCTSAKEVNPIVCFTSSSGEINSFRSVKAKFWMDKTVTIWKSFSLCLDQGQFIKCIYWASSCAIISTRIVA